MTGMDRLPVVPDRRERQLSRQQHRTISLLSFVLACCCCAISNHQIISLATASSIHQGGTTTSSIFQRSPAVNTRRQTASTSSTLCTGSNSRNSRRDNDSNNQVSVMSATKKTRLTRRERKEVEEIQKEIQRKQREMQGIVERDVCVEEVEASSDKPSLQDIKQQLGFTGRLIADAVEVGMVAGGSYFSGGAMGLVGGGAFSLPALLKKEGLPLEDLTKLGLNAGSQPNFVQKCKFIRNKSLAAGHSWGTLSASFSGFHALVRVARGGTDDKWTGVISSGCAGAFMSRAAGPEAMIRGASTFAGITYVIDLMGGGKKTANHVDQDFDFEDYPVVEGKGKRGR